MSRTISRRYNFAGSTARFLDALYVTQATTTDPRERTRIVRAFERHALREAYTVPLLWWNRIVATSAKLKGWTITPATSSARTSRTSGSTSKTGHNGSGVHMVVGREGGPSKRHR
jgi:ABC-type transport system substrate-binding protein